MSSAVFPDPSFTWHSHRRERWTWRSISLLLAITASVGFYVGRLSIAVPVPTEQPTGSKPEQQTASAGSVMQRQAALHSDASAAPIRSTANTETKPEAKDGPIEGSTASSMETPKRGPTAATERGSASSPVVLISPSSAAKAAGGDASKQPLFNTGLEAAAKRQVESRSPGRSSARAAPRRDSVVVRRDDAYVLPRMPQAAYADQRGRYDNADGDDDRPRLGQLYPDRRYAEDAPAPRTHSEYRREYLRPFQDSRNVREYRRFGGYDDDPNVNRRPMLRPMYGGPDY